MTLGYNKALYLLPFDHRRSYVQDMFDFKPPLTPPQRDQVIDSKQLIYEGFKQALSEGVQAFAKSWSALMARIQEKSLQPAATRTAVA